MIRLKSVLAGCAAGFIALGAAQAADLPVKAKPVEYVKICSLYGVGFYYIPGTDMCIKVGGYVREQVEINSNSGMGFGTANSTWGPNTAASIGGFDRGSNTFNFTTRAMLSVDTRNQTEYGTVRGYIRLGMRVIDQTSATFYFDRAVIQWAGFTVGRTLSFFDIFTTTEQYSYFDTKNSGDTVNNAVDVLAYTAQFGNGLSATISAEFAPQPGRSCQRRYDRLVCKRSDELKWNRRAKHAGHYWPATYRPELGLSWRQRCRASGGRDKLLRECCARPSR